MLLKRLLEELANQETDGLFTYSIVVTENDSAQSAKATVTAFAETAKVDVTYCVEPKQNIALARNRAIQNATGEFVAFIDDDEFPANRWLYSLVQVADRPGVAGVLGPVLPYFDDAVPKWVVRGKFYERPQHQTGLVLSWAQTRTGNALVKRELFTGDNEPFNAKCLEGSDQEFFKRMMQQGHTFIWCNEATVYEVVPPARWKRSFLIRRALMRGVFSVRNHRFPLSLITTSLVATPAYAIVLPLALLLGQARFMNSVFKFFYHAGRLLAVLGINPIRQAYVSD